MVEKLLGYLYNSMIGTAILSAIILMNCITSVAIVATIRYVYG